MASIERALRRMIAELAEMPAQERDAVLEQLTDIQSEKVRTLLAEYEGASQAPTSTPIDRQGLPQNLSPWLLELLDAGKVADGALDLRRPTQHAVDVLKACAAELTTAPRAGDGTKPPRWHALSRHLPTARRKAGAR